MSVTTGSVADDLPKIAMDGAGDAVVVYDQWTSYDPYAIEANRISAAGALSAQIFVGLNAYGYLGPSVECSANGGFFAVAYTQEVADGPLTVEVDVLDPSNNLADSYNLGPNFGPSVGALGSFGFLVAYSSFGSSGFDNDIYGRFGFYY